MSLRSLTPSPYLPLDLDRLAAWSNFGGSSAQSLPVSGSGGQMPLFASDAFGFELDEVPEETREGLRRFIDANQGAFDGAVDTPEELRKLLQMLHMNEGQNAGLPKLETKPGTDLADMSAQEMLQLLIDYLSNFNNNENNNRPAPRMLGTLGQGGGGGGGGGGTGGGGGGGTGGGGGGGGAPVGSAGPSTGASSVPPTGGGAGGNVEQWRPMVREYAAKYGIPENQIPQFENYVLAMMKVESGGNPNAIGDNGHSVGLFQMHDQGAGHGMSVEQRKDPRVQFDTMMPKFVAAFRSGQAQGLDGADLAIHIAREAERPIASALPKYGQAYNEIVA